MNATILALSRQADVLGRALIVGMILAIYLLPGRVPGIPVSIHGLLLLPLLGIAALWHRQRLFAKRTLLYWALLGVMFVSAIVAGTAGPDVFRPLLFGILTAVVLMALAGPDDLRVVFLVMLPLLVLDAVLGSLLRLWPGAPEALLDAYLGPMQRPLHRGTFITLAMLATGAVYLRTGRSGLLVPYTLLVIGVIVTALRGVWVGAFVGLLTLIVLDRRILRSVTLLALAALSFVVVEQSVQSRVEETGDLAYAVGSTPLPQPAIFTQAAAPPPAESKPTTVPAPPATSGPEPARPAGAQRTEPSVAPGPTASEVQRATFALDFFVKSGAAKFLEELTPAGRLGYWQAGMRMAVAHPVLGVGPGNFPREFPRYATGPRRDVETTSDPHSVYVGILAELGFTGALVLAAILIAAAVAVWRRRAWLRSHPELTATAAGLVAVCAIGLTWDMHVQRVFWLAVGLFGAAKAVPTTNDPA